MKTLVVNLRRESFDVYIGRKGKGQDGYFGNPFPLRFFKPEESMAMFRFYFLGRVEHDPEFRRRVLALRGKRLGCFCKPGRCHGDVIAAWCDSQTDSSDLPEPFIRCVACPRPAKPGSRTARGEPMCFSCSISAVGCPTGDHAFDDCPGDHGK